MRHANHHHWMLAPLVVALCLLVLGPAAFADPIGYEGLGLLPSPSHAFAFPVSADAGLSTPSPAWSALGGGGGDWGLASQAATFTDSVAVFGPDAGALSWGSDGSGCCAAEACCLPCADFGLLLLPLLLLIPLLTDDDGPPNVPVTPPAVPATTPVPEPGTLVLLLLLLPALWLLRRRARAPCAH